jgi:hypothetical protein
MISKVSKHETIVNIWGKRNEELFDQMARFEEEYTCVICGRKRCEHMLKEKARLFSNKSDKAIENLFALKLIFDKLH